MKTNKIQTGSPDWLTDRLDQIYQRTLSAIFAQFYHSVIYKFLVITSLYLLAISTLFYKSEISRLLLKHDRFAHSFLSLRFELLAAVFFSSVFLLWMKPRLTRQLLPGLSCLAIAACIIAASGENRIEMILISFTVGGLLPIASFYALLHFPQILRTPLFLLTIVMCLSFLSHFSEGRFNSLNNQGWWIVRTERMILSIAVIFSELHAGILRLPPLGLPLFGYIFSPQNLIFPLPVRSQQLEIIEENSVHKRVFFDGVIDILIATFIFILSAAVRIWLHGLKWNLDENAFTTKLILGWGIYLYYFANSFAILRTAVGIGRLMGFQLSDPYHFPLLAATPQDRWRRWNTYFYSWFMSFTFIPVMRKTNSLFLAIFLTFLITYLLHESANTVSVFRGEGSFVAIWYMQSRLAFFMAHAAVVYFALKTEYFWPSGKSIWGWCSVLVTHILMSLVHYIAR